MIVEIPSILVFAIVTVSLATAAYALTLHAFKARRQQCRDDLIILRMDLVNEAIEGRVEPSPEFVRLLNMIEMAIHEAEQSTAVKLIAYRYFTRDLRRELERLDADLWAAELPKELQPFEDRYLHVMVTSTMRGSLLGFTAYVWLPVAVLAYRLIKHIPGNRLSTASEVMVATVEQDPEPALSQHGPRHAGNVSYRLVGVPA